MGGRDAKLANDWAAKNPGEKVDATSPSIVKAVEDVTKKVTKK